MLGAEVIDQGPGLGIQVALIAATESGVANQALQARAGIATRRQSGSLRSWARLMPAQRPPRITSNCAANPSCSQMREGIVSRHEAAVARQLMDHLVGRRPQVDRPPIQVQ